MTHNKANTPLEGVSNVDATVPVVRKVYVSSGCQIDIPAVSSEGNHWELLAKKRLEELNDEVKKGEKLRNEIEQLKEQLKILEDRKNDKEYFAMMYKIASTE